MVYVEMVMNYDRPKLAFQRVQVDPLALEYANAYYPGCFTQTGLHYDNADYRPMLEWCNIHGIEHDNLRCVLRFKSEQELTWFLLHWG